MFRENENVLTDAGGNFYSTDSRLSTAQDVFLHTSDQDIEQNQLLHTEWSTDKMATAQVIRKLFPRPKFFPKRTEISVKKKIIIQNGRADKQTVYSTDDQFQFS